MILDRFVTIGGNVGCMGVLPVFKTGAFNRSATPPGVLETLSFRGKSVNFPGIWRVFEKSGLFRLPGSLPIMHIALGLRLILCFHLRPTA